jgi:hypothetical protein
LGKPPRRIDAEIPQQPPGLPSGSPRGPCTD